MSSPKAAIKPARRPATAAKLKAVATRTVAPKPKTPQTGLSADAIKLAGDIEQAFKKSDDAISEDAMQTLMAALVENGAKYTPIAEGQIVSPTGVMVTASGLLRAANLAVFELGMWQSWTGR